MLNLLVTVVLTFVFRAAGVEAGVDGTQPSDYHADAGDPAVADELDPITTPPTT